MFVLLNVLAIYMGRNVTLVNQCINSSRRPVKGLVDKIYEYSMMNLAVTF